ncbi:MAG: transglutaminase domain-containing protein [Deltaproteobacteria bacterium]
MKTLRSLIISILLLALCYFSLPPLTQAVPSHQDEAQILNSLGLLKGSSNGFNLERKPTRAEGAVMLVRLLGGENQAIGQNYQHPFRDVPAWASPYVGYMYTASLTQGSGPATFSPDDPLSALAYTAFVLRALGYSDQSGDFDYNSSLDKARELGMLTSQRVAALANRPFIREDMVNLSYLALKMPLKNRSTTLIEKLVYQDRAVSPAAAQESGLIGQGAGLISQVSFADKASPDTNNQYSVSSSYELQDALERAILNLQPQITLSFSNYPGDPFADFKGAMNQAEAEIENSTGLVNLINEWRYEGNDRILNVGFSFRYSWSQLVQLNLKADKIIESLLENNQTDYEKEKLLHDYIINNCRYDYDNYQRGAIPETSRTAYGVLLQGRGVCQGYAEAMNILCRKAGLSSMMVKGQSRGENHAWNLVEIEGKYYHVDPTWDDPYYSNGQDALAYDYFNLSDDEILKDHMWERNEYPPCNSMQYNYHFYNGQYENDYSGFADYVSSAIARGEKSIDVRISDFNLSDYSDLGPLVFQSRAVTYYHYSINEAQGVVKLFGLEYR